MEKSSAPGPSQDKLMSAFGGDRQKYPIASTPAVQSSEEAFPFPSTSTLNKPHRENLRLAVGPMALSEDEFLRPSDLNFKRSNVTFRGKHDSTAASLSPIVASESFRNPMHVQFTEPRGVAGGRQLFPYDKDGNSIIVHPAESTGIFCQPSGASSADSSQVGGYSANNFFPYPSLVTHMTESMESEDPGEVLCNHLRVLVALRRVEYEKIRLLGGGFKRKEKAEGSILKVRVDDDLFSLEFTNETFVGINTEASTQAFRLLFTSLDLKESEQRFRDCWPVYEKKIEGMFRRVALEWMKEIILQNPIFFPELKMEALAGLLVNPGGDRFTIMLTQFCRFVMYSVATRKTDIVRKQVLLPPKTTDDPEIANRQLHVLSTRSMKMASANISRYRNLLKSDLETNRCVRAMDELSKLISQYRELYTSKVRSLVDKHPDIFGYPSEEDFAEREERLFEMRLTDIVDNATEYDPFRQKMEEHLKKRAEDIYKPVSLLQDIMMDHSKIWHILEMDKIDLVVLECNKLSRHQLQNEATGELSLNHFVDSFLDVAQNLMNDPCLSGPAPKELQTKLEAIRCRMNFTRMMKAEICKTPFEEMCTRLRDAKNYRDLLKARLEGCDWTKLSRISECGQNNKLWDMTPIRTFDMDKSSGRTPSINNFLDLSAMTSSGEQNTSVVKRRSASIAKPRVPQKPAHLRRSLQTSTLETASAISQSAHDGLSSTPLSGQQNGRRVHLNVSVGSTIKKSVSFESTSFSDASFDIDESKCLNFSQRMSSSMISSQFTGSPALNGQLLTPSSQSISGAGDISASESASDVPVELDATTQDRVHRLLASIAPKSRSSLSPFASESVSEIGQISESSGKRKSVGINLNEGGEDSASDLFGNISLIDDWADMETKVSKEWETTKGIMDVSYVELFRNSDSDD